MDDGLSLISADEICKRLKENENSVMLNWHAPTEEPLVGAEVIARRQGGYSVVTWTGRSFRTIWNKTLETIRNWAYAPGEPARTLTARRLEANEQMKRREERIGARVVQANADKADYWTMAAGMCWGEGAKAFCAKLADAYNGRI